LHIGGAVLYKAQRSGILRPARVTTGDREGLTVIFPRCNTERTIDWDPVVIFDANRVDQPWRVADGSTMVFSAGSDADGLKSTERGVFIVRYRLGLSWYFCLQFNVHTYVEVSSLAGLAPPPRIQYVLY
jgi:hypothetical protein